MLGKGGPGEHDGIVAPPPGDDLLEEIAVARPECDPDAVVGHICGVNRAVGQIGCPDVQIMKLDGECPRSFWPDGVNGYQSRIGEHVVLWVLPAPCVGAVSERPELVASDSDQLSPPFWQLVEHANVRVCSISHYPRLSRSVHPGDNHADCYSRRRVSGGCVRMHGSVHPAGEGSQRRSRGCARHGRRG